MEHDELLEARVTSADFDADAASVRSVRGVEKLGDLFELEVVLVWPGDGSDAGAERLGDLPKLDAITGASIAVHFEMRKRAGGPRRSGASGALSSAGEGAFAGKVWRGPGRGRASAKTGAAAPRPSSASPAKPALPPPGPGRQNVAVYRGGKLDGATTIPILVAASAAEAARGAAPEGGRWVTIFRQGEPTGTTWARDDHAFRDDGRDDPPTPSGMQRVRLLRGGEPIGHTFVPADVGGDVDGVDATYDETLPPGALHEGMRRVPSFRGGRLAGYTWLRDDDGAEPIQAIEPLEEAEAGEGMLRVPILRGCIVEGFASIRDVDAADDGDDAGTEAAALDEAGPPTPPGMRRVPLFRGGQPNGFTFVPIASGPSPSLLGDEAREALAELRRAVEGAELVRTVHGLVVEATERIDAQRGDLVVTVRVRPRAHNLTLVETYQVFLESSLPDILRTKLNAGGLAREGQDFELRLEGDFSPIDFVAQYRESDLAFVKRLCEHHGLTLFFEHDDESDKLVISNHNAAFPASSRPAALRVNRAGGLGVGEIRELGATKKLIPSLYVEMDYNHRSPQLDLTSQHELDDAYGGGIVEYGAHYRDPAEGARIARMRSEEQRAGQLVYEGLCHDPGVRPGTVLTIHDDHRLGRLEVLITEVRHELTQSSSLHDDGDGHYACRFRGVPADRTYRPPRVTPRPRIHGILHAIVDPLPNDEIGEFSNLDDQGRYTVRLYFDVAGSTRDVASKRVRMVQMHAGGHYGAHMPLKPGIEVMIAFVDGDPDRPVIVGSIPNPVTPSPVTSANSTMNRFKTVSGVLIEMKDRG